LVFIVLAVTNFRLILENMLKYGLLFNPLTFLRAAVTPTGNLPMVACWPALGVFALCALGVEGMAARLLKKQKHVSQPLGVLAPVAGWREYQWQSRSHLGILLLLLLLLSDGTQPCSTRHYPALSPPSCPPHAQAGAAHRKRGEGTASSPRVGFFVRNTEYLVFLLNFIVCGLTLAVPFVVISKTNAEPVPSFALTTMTVLLFLKLVSFAHVNSDLRCGWAGVWALDWRVQGWVGSRGYHR
jgi:hypothetical protein